MTEYIEREALTLSILGLTIVDPAVAQYAEAVFMQINQFPAADVAPVRHGRWLKQYRSGISIDKGYVSSCCDMWNERKSTYCPNCGAKMDADGAGEHLPRHPGMVRALPDPAGAVAAWDVQHTVF